MTHTYAILEVSGACWDEIAGKLSDAGYKHSFDGDVIDMHGIALKTASGATAKEKLEVITKAFGKYRREELLRSAWGKAHNNIVNPDATTSRERYLQSPLVLTKEEYQAVYDRIQEIPKSRRIQGPNGYMMFSGQEVVPDESN